MDVFLRLAFSIFWWFQKREKLTFFITTSERIKLESCGWSQIFRNLNSIPNRSNFLKIDWEFAKLLPVEVRWNAISKKTLTSPRNFLAKSSSILKKYERYRKKILFPVIWEVAQHSILIRSEVVRKNVSFLHFQNIQKML